MIYFIQIGHDGPVKIGVSDNPYRRMYALQGSHPQRLHLIGLTPGNRFDEGRLHAELREWALGREWYEPEADVLAAIEEPLGHVAETIDCALEAREHLRVAIRGLRGIEDTEAAESHLRIARDLIAQALEVAIA